MKFQDSRLTAALLPLAIVCLTASPAAAATLATMTFDNSGADINETGGWNGTTAPGGSLAAGLTVTSGMTAYGDFTAHTKNDAFVAHNWSGGNTAETRVGMTIAAVSGYNFSLGGGSETFSTRLHHTPENQTDVFTSVQLIINGNVIGSQTYVPGNGVQNLTWNIGSNPALNNLTSATFDLKFTGLSTHGGPNHGPQWEDADNAFVSFTGTVIPEASQAVLAFLGMGLSLFRRRR